MGGGPLALASEKQRHPCAGGCPAVKQNRNRKRGRSARPGKSPAANLIGKINKAAPCPFTRVFPANLARLQNSPRPGRLDSGVPGTSFL